jgi:hypothetical protein
MELLDGKAADSPQYGKFHQPRPPMEGSLRGMMLDVGCESWPSNLPTLRLNLDCCRLGARYRQNGHDLDAFPGKNHKAAASCESARTTM